MKRSLLFLTIVLAGFHMNLANAQTAEKSTIYTTDSKEQKQKPGKNYPLRNTDTAWLASSEARRIAEQVMAYQGFYDLENCEVYVCDRDGIPKRSLQEIGHERRNGYSWYNTRPAEILPAYLEWKQKWGETKTAVDGL